MVSVEAEKQSLLVVVGSKMPRPPWRTGRAMSGRSLMASSTVEFRSAGRKKWAIAISNGAKA